MVTTSVMMMAGKFMDSLFFNRLHHWIKVPKKQKFKNAIIISVMWVQVSIRILGVLCRLCVFYFDAFGNVKDKALMEFVDS